MVDIPQAPEPVKEEDFDPSDALLETLFNDVEQLGNPCMESIEKLLMRSCYADEAKDKGETGKK